MKINYKEEYINNPDGIACQLIDVDALSFDDCPIGCKSTVTLIKKAKGGEVITTYGKKGEVESFIVAEQGDAIFCNSETDVYIPSLNGERYKFDKICDYGYKIVSAEEGQCHVKSTNQARLLIEVVDRPACIKDAFGKEIHQFLFKGATIKKDLKTGAVSGISKVAFDTTWEVLNEDEMELG